mmetsp:Transcript_8403/g.13672  ORF Transcript_8403/g.13672 Transcript_8403/m.13672 type:complete len:280 (-) Transcript_8403:669-1508(-)
MLCNSRFHSASFCVASSLATSICLDFSTSSFFMLSFASESLFTSSLLLVSSFSRADFSAPMLCISCFRAASLRTASLRMASFCFNFSTNSRFLVSFVIVSVFTSSVFLDSSLVSFSILSPVAEAPMIEGSASNRSLSRFKNEISSFAAVNCSSLSSFSARSTCVSRLCTSACSLAFALSSAINMRSFARCSCAQKSAFSQISPLSKYNLPSSRSSARMGRLMPSIFTTNCLHAMMSITVCSPFGNVSLVPAMEPPVHIPSSAASVSSLNAVASSSSLAW